MKKNLTYNYFQQFTKNKDKAVNYIIEQSLQKTLSMFVYKGLPQTIPQKDLEYILQVNGTAFITEVDGSLYALNGDLGGEIDVYNFPTKYTVANVALNLSKCFEIKTDGVLVKNDFLCNGLVTIIGKHAVLLTDSQISLNTAAILTRLTMLISASDDKTKQSADIFIEKILNGDLSVIAENAFLKGVNLQAIPSTQNTSINALIELNQYYKANLLGEIGLNSNWNAKRERLNEKEILLNNDEILPFIDNMLFERQNAVEKINKKYNTNIEVELNTAWKTNKENNDKAVNTLNTETEFENVSRENITENAKEQNENHTNNDEFKEEQTSIEKVSRENEETDKETEIIVNAIREIRNEEIKQNKNENED